MLRRLAMLTSLLPALALAQIQVPKVRLCDTNGLNCAGAPASDPSSAAVALPVRVILGTGQKAAFGSVRIAEEFPLLHLQFPYNVNPLLVTTTTANGGTVTQSNAKAVLQTTTNTAGSAKMESNDRVRYVPGQGVTVRFTALFTACAASSTQEVGIGDDTDGFFFGCYAGAFGVNRRQNGSNNVVAQTAWNADKMDGTGTSGQTLTLTNGNVYAVQYQWLGFGAVRFFIEDSTTGDLVLVHTIRYANTATTPTIFNPSLPLHAKAVNAGNNTNLTLQVASMGAVAEGPANLEIGSRQSTTSLKTGVGTALTNLLTVQNKTTFNGVTNRTKINVDHLSLRISATGGQDGFFQLVKNATLGGVPSFVDISTANSVAAVDTAGTTVTGGTAVLSFSGGNGTSQNVDLTPYDVEMSPGDTLTCAVASEAVTITARCSMSWVEEF